VTDLAPVLQGFFTDRLARQKKASPNAVAAYRDTCRLLLAFAPDLRDLIIRWSGLNEEGCPGTIVLSRTPSRIVAHDAVDCGYQEEGEGPNDVATTALAQPAHATVPRLAVSGP
jgi:hypothetical protein